MCIYKTNKHYIWVYCYLYIAPLLGTVVRNATTSLLNDTLTRNGYACRVPHRAEEAAPPTNIARKTISCRCLVYRRTVSYIRTI